MDFKTTTLANGLSIVSKNIPGTKSATLGYFINTGSYDEKEFPSGLAHFVEHMMFKGTKYRNSKEISEDFDFIGAMTNAYTSHRLTKYYCHIPFDVSEKALNFLNDLVWNSTYPINEIEKERNVILEEHKMISDKPSQRVFQNATNHIYKDHPERQDIIGTVESIKSISRDDIVRFVDAFYQPNNMMLVATGNVDHDAIVKQLSAYPFTREQSFHRKKDVFQQPTIKTKHLKEEKDIAQAHLAWYINGPTSQSDDSYAAKVLSNILGSGMSSRLFTRIREEKGLAYAVYAGLQSDCDSGFFLGYVGCDRANIEAVKETIVEEYLIFIDEYATERELQKAKNNARSKIMLSLESTQTINDFIGRRLFENETLDVDTIIKGYDSVTLDDVKNVAKKYFNRDNVLFSSIEPKQ